MAFPSKIIAGISLTGKWEWQSWAILMLLVWGCNEVVSDNTHWQTEYSLGNAYNVNKAVPLNVLSIQSKWRDRAG